jgi:hypothetical protein
MRWFALALVIALAGGCSDENNKPEEGALKAECRALEKHLFQITPRAPGGAPEADPKRLEELVAQVPIEDVEQCAAIKDRKVIACMQAAGTVAAVRACIPAKKE